MIADGARHPLLSRVRAGEILVGDGAMGTQLFERGLAPGDCPESWNLSRPEVLEEIARSYLEAGSDIVETNTFGASPLKLARYALDARTEEINRAAVEAVRRAVGTRAVVAACLGPSGRMLKPYGDADPGEVSASYERQIAALAGAGVAAFCIETMTDLKEAALAVRAAKSVAPGLPVMATMTFDPTPRGFFTIMGADVASAARGLEEAGADVVGSNCGNGIENMIAIAREFRRHTDLPLLIQSNAGLPEREGDRVVYRETPSFMAGRALELVALGVSIIGGCCGTTPGHIRALRAAVDGARRDR
jgi:5-methyltetrahydrofolate--homocysteine methyltransferase